MAGTLAWSIAPVASCGFGAEAPALLTPEQAQRAAWTGFAAKLPLHPEAFRQAAAGTAAAAPLRVERLDRPGDFYYIVPFVKNGRATLLVVVDARTGAFKEAVPRTAELPYPAVDEARARAVLRGALRDPADLQAAGHATPDLVWKPSAATQSPYEPLWRFRFDGKTWYVDQRGHASDRIAEPPMKGGGPPGAG